VQAWAREERYRAASEIALTGPGTADVAAGHTATDQVETILYRLASSPSRRALLGMRPRQGALIRPLLGCTREQTAAYCRERGLGWREDASNGSDAYARGRVRHGLVPALREIHPAAEQNVLALLEVLREEAEVLEELVDDALGGRPEIELERLRGLAPALRRLVVQRLADGAAGRPAPGTARRADEIAALRDHASLDLPHGVRAEVRRGTLRLVRRNGAVAATAGSHNTGERSSPIN
jgi:tRNA(Ile)-lysidine synthase